MSEWKKAGAMGDTHDFEKEPTIEGVYIECRENQGKKKNSTIYTIKLPDGKPVGVWGTTVLDRKMDEVPVGSEVRITHLGKRASDKGGPEYHDWTVEYREGAVDTAASMNG